MKKFNNLTMAVALAIGASATAFGAAEKPTFMFPNYGEAKVIQGLSNNGKYGVSARVAQSNGNAYHTGAVVYDLTAEDLNPVYLSEGRDYAGANDVSDDGLVVVGSLNLQPTVFRKVNGTWTTETMPLPQETIKIPMHDYFTGEDYEEEFIFDSGDIRAVTPDGKYGVGLALCKNNEMMERGVLWDLEKKEIIPTNCSITNRWGMDDHQNRFMQLSDDARYILGYNSFSYPDDDLIFIYDRNENKMIYPMYSSVANGKPVLRYPGYENMEIDGLVCKSLTSDGHYFTGRVQKGEGSYSFIFDVWTETLDIFNDGVHEDTWGWAVTKDGLVLAAEPASTPYADALIYYNNYMYPLKSVYEEVYGLNLSSMGMDNTGKPTLVSEDAQTVVFVDSPTSTYVVRFHEPLTNALDRINLMSGWNCYPPEGTKMAKMSEVSFNFNSQIVLSDESKKSGVVLLDSKGATVATANNVKVENMRLTVSFPETALNAGETYTVVLPAGLCGVKGMTGSTNDEIRANFVGRANVPVKVSNISPADGSALPNLNLNDNPVVVRFDAAVKINGTFENRPLAHVYVNDSKEPAAALNLDVDQNTNTLVIYPTATYYMYKGGTYRVDVPAGAVVDLSGAGPSEAFSVTYNGSYVPQLGSELYLFESYGDDYNNFLFYEGDEGVPTSEYENLGFTALETPWKVVRDNENATDNYLGSHSCYKDGRKADDWITTRQLNMPDDVTCYLTFQSQSYRNAKKDYLKVYVYENNISLLGLDRDVINDILKNGDLIYNELQSPGKTEGNFEGEWTDNTISLEKYKGKNIYICFLNDNQNQSLVAIDNIFVKKDISSFITITSQQNVVNLASAPIEGILSIQSDLADYNKVALTLKDESGKEVSKVEATGLSLTGGESYNFKFPQELPLTVGVENEYSIVYVLDDEDPITYNGVVRDLAFQTEKRVVLEEMTGRDCPNCPLGLSALERLESLYGDKLIPIALHCYNGSDPKGAGVMDYAQVVFMGNGSAPNGRINRRPKLVAPMYSDNETGRFHMTAADVEGAENVWQDEIVAELGEPTFLDITATPKVSGGVVYDVTVKSALNLKDQNIRLLGVLLEDKLNDRQSNSQYNTSDPLLGEFGRGGIYGNSMFLYEFNNVARGYWGQSPNGTPRLFPPTLEVGKEYTAEIVYDMPDIVQVPENTKMAIILIDENTSKVINAVVAKADVTGVEEIISDETAVDLTIVKYGNEIRVNGVDDLQVAVYTLDGRMLRNVYGNGEVTLDLDGYKGLVIVNAASSGKTATVKLMM